MTKHHSIAASLILLAATLSPLTAHADKKGDALAQAGVQAGRAWGYLRGEGLDGSDLNTRLSSAIECEAAVKAAKDAGAKPSDEANVEEHNFPGAREQNRPQTPTEYMAKLAAIDAMCTRYYDEVVTFDARSVLERAQKALVEARANQAPAQDQHVYLGLDGSRCNDGIERSLALGATLASSVKVNGTLTTLGDAKQQICQPLLDESNRLRGAHDDAKKAAEDAVMAPYRKVLSGDKLRIIESTGPDVSGVGGRSLKTPAAIKQAKVIFTYVSWDDIYELRRYEFKGMKLVRESSRQFVGEPPARAYK